MNNKQQICDLLCKTLQATRGGSNLVSLEYDAFKEIVTATFKNGRERTVNVAADSGTAMIHDILLRLDF